MVEAVTEVVDVVSNDRVLSIVKSTLVGTLARTSEISLKSRCASVQDAKSISIISPCISEGLLQLFRLELLEWLALRLAAGTELVELLVSDLPREDTLDDVSSVEAVHAVCPHDTSLSAQDPASCRINVLSLVKGHIHLSHEVTILLQLVINRGNQLREVLPFHLLALAVEVEPGVADVLIL